MTDVTSLSHTFLIPNGCATWRKVVLKGLIREKKKKRPPNDHRHRRQSARVQLLTTSSQALGMIPSLPAICSCSDIPAVSGHDFWHNKPVRPEWELPDSDGAQVYPVCVTNQQQQRKALVWCSRHSTKAELGYSIYLLLWWPHSASFGTPRSALSSVGVFTGVRDLWMMHRGSDHKCELRSVLKFNHFMKMELSIIY